MVYEFHEIAGIFPLMEKEELEALTKDIAENGLQEPIILYEGKILDGRNRYLACLQAGVEPWFKQYIVDDPLRISKKP